MTPAEINFIKEAVAALEHPNFMIKALSYLGKPIEKGIEALPAKVQNNISSITSASLEKAFQTAVKTLGVPRNSGTLGNRLRVANTSRLIHTATTALTGALGGAFGYAGLAIELPITTGIMLRSIADIAQEFGHDLSQPDIQLQCLSVFSLGSRSKSDDSSETGYYVARMAMAKMIQDAVTAVSKEAAPSLVRLIATIAGRFEVVVTEKFVLEAVPLLGAVTGAGINTIFSTHFCTVAKYHFGLLRLEHEKGAAAVRHIYDTEAAR